MSLAGLKVVAHDQADKDLKADKDLQRNFFPPASAVEGIKTVPFVCPCVCVPVSVSALLAEYTRKVTSQLSDPGF